MVCQERQQCDSRYKASEELQRSSWIWSTLNTAGSLCVAGNWWKPCDDANFSWIITLKQLPVASLMVLKVLRCRKCIYEMLLSASPFSAGSHTCGAFMGNPGSLSWFWWFLGEFSFLCSKIYKQHTNISNLRPDGRIVNRTLLLFLPASV